MIPAGSLRLIDGEESPIASVPFAGDGPLEPKVFVRTVATPPGWPWDQARSADLEARHGAPLPLADVIYRLRRLEAWRPGSPSRFAAFYVLARDVSGRLDATAQVDGRSLEVTFLSAGEEGRRARTLGLIGIATAVVCFLVVGAIGSALAKRATLESALEMTEQRASVKLKAVRARERLKAQNRALNLWPDRGAPLGDVMADIAWASAAKAPQAQIDALHWENGMMAVEARGPQSPFAFIGDRTLQRSDKPVRRGVWLWGVAPRPVAAQLKEPIDAVPLDDSAGRP